MILLGTLKLQKINIKKKIKRKLFTRSFDILTFYFNLNAKPQTEFYTDIYKSARIKVKAKDDRWNAVSDGEDAEFFSTKYNTNMITICVRLVANERSTVTKGEIKSPVYPTHRSMCTYCSRIRNKYVRVGACNHFNNNKKLQQQ